MVNCQRLKLAGARVYRFVPLAEDYHIRFVRQKEVQCTCFCCARSMAITGCPLSTKVWPVFGSLITIEPIVRASWGAWYNCQTFDSLISVALVRFAQTHRSTKLTDLHHDRPRLGFFQHTINTRSNASQKNPPPVSSHLQPELAQGATVYLTWQ
jgi:hypothetical protein